MFICFFLCWWQRHKESTTLSVSPISFTMPACRSPQLPQQLQRPHLQRWYPHVPLQGWQWRLGGEDCSDRWDMVLYHWDNKYPPLWGSSLHHQRGTGRAPPGWSHQGPRSWQHICFLLVLQLQISFVYRRSENGAVKEEDNIILHPTWPYQTDPTRGWTLNSHSSQ